MEFDLYGYDASLKGHGKMEFNEKDLSLRFIGLQF